jgi:hypothetical protein
VKPVLRAARRSLRARASKPRCGTSCRSACAGRGSRTKRASPHRSSDTTWSAGHIREARFAAAQGDRALLAIEREAGRQRVPCESVHAHGGHAWKAVLGTAQRRHCDLVEILVLVCR